MCPELDLKKKVVFADETRNKNAEDNFEKRFS